ncbi:TonB-dependent receptor [Caulobacter mirabilis]|uniref:TonB-dependent receptor n=2 Tax=Caulobacter mirabilis TaxID=69666 RepID=A0A2D2B0W0_9CAUL|nr:TonB-dependent receptor [Caulobacter mirabilis]
MVLEASLASLMVVWSAAGSMAASPEVTVPPAASEDPEQAALVEGVEVVGRRGAAKVPPETELDAADIDALGAYDIGEVLRRLTERLGPGEEPMVIINGKRTPNAGVFSGFPPDALVRAEVLPREAASLYGGAPGQRVVNLVLQRRFSSRDALAAGGRPVAGGTSSLNGDLRRSAISGNDTHQFGARISRQTALRAGERDRGDLSQGDGGRLTLRPRVDAAAANVAMTKALGDWLGALSVNGQTRDSRSVARFGADVGEVRRVTDSLGLTAGVSGDAMGWSVQFGLAGQASRTREGGLSSSRSAIRSISASVAADRPLFELPAGPVTANLSAQVLASRSTVETDVVRRSLSARSEDARITLSAPLARRDEDGQDGYSIGDVRATVGATMRRTASAGGEGVDAAVSWIPRQGVRFNGLWSTSSESVADQQRFEPLQYGAPTVVFDFRRGEAVEVTPILGGNPDLRPPRSERSSISAFLGPFTPWSLAGSVDFQRFEARDGIGALPALTQDVEAAFPERFRRDDQGRLISIDRRPLNIRSTSTETLVTSVSLALPTPPEGPAPRGTSLRLTLNHTWRVRSAMLLHERLPEMDRLAGDGGGVARQEIGVQLDGRRGRWGVNAGARWQDGYRVRRVSGRDDPGDLVVDPFLSVDLKLSLRLNAVSSAGRTGEATGEPRRGRNDLQLDLEIENLFDARPAARLGDGSPAPGYGRDMQDPLGRSVRLVLKRRF